MTTVVVADLAGEPTYALDIERDVLGDAVDLQQFRYDGDDAALAAAGRDADCVLTAYVPITAATIAEWRRCKLISIAATGYDNVDVTAAVSAGIRVCALHNYCTDEVADHTMLLILALARRLTEYHHHVQVDQQWHYDAFSGLHRLSGKTLGLVGLGSIGRAVASRAQSFGLNVIASDPHVDQQDASKLDVAMRSLGDLLKEADIISLHCNQTAVNEKLLGREAFASMHQRPVLINVARGGLIDEAALLDALDRGQISAAGLDVLESESPELDSCGLVGRPNVILTPHVAFYSDASMAAIHRESALNIRNFLDGRHEAVNHYVDGHH